MRIDPINILLKGNNLHFKKKIFLISGNEETLIKKIPRILKKTRRGKNIKTPIF